MSGLPQIEGFHLERELGRGAMGVVYQARDVLLNRPVALKVILGNASPTALQRFAQEATASSQLDHPNLVRVLSAGRTHGRPYLALEFVEGETLKARLARQGALDPRTAARIVAQLARGVAHAHERGVIHRDIKPENVLMVGDTPRLTDFGLARLGDRGMTRSGMVMGTPAYMSPEQAEGDPDRVGPLSDVYSLGAVLHALLGGQAPFRGKSALATVRKVLEEQPPPLPDLPPDLGALLFRTLEKAPELRPPSAHALAEALDAWLDGPRAQAASGKSSRLALALALTSTLAALGLASYLVLTRQPPLDAPRGEPKPTFEDALAKLRERRAWGEVEQLLREARPTATDAQAIGLDLEQAYLDLRLGRNDPLESLRASLSDCPPELEGRAQALLAWAHARHLDHEAARLAARAAEAATPEDGFVARILAQAELERHELELSKDAAVVAARFRRARDLGDEQNPEALLFELWLQPPAAGDPAWDRLQRLARESEHPLAELLLARRANSAAARRPRLLRAQQAAPRWGWLILQVAELHAQASRSTGELSELRELFDLALEVSPADPRVVQGVALRGLELARRLNDEVQQRAQAGQHAHADEVYEQHLLPWLDWLDAVLQTGLERFDEFTALSGYRVQVIVFRDGVPAALEELESVLAAHPTDAFLWSLRASLCEVDGRPAEAMRAAEEAARLDPGKYAQAVERLRVSQRAPTALALDPEAAEVAMLREAARWGRVEVELTQAAKQGELSPALQFERAYFDLRLGRDQEALDVLRPLSARAEGALAARVHALRAWAEARLLHEEEFRAAFSVAEANGRDDWLVLRLLGYSAYSRALLSADPRAQETASTLLRSAISAGDTNPETRAWAMLATGRVLDIPRPDLERLMRETPSPLTRTILAKHLIRREPRDLTRAIALARAALEEAPAWGYLHARVGLLFTDRRLWPALETNGRPAQEQALQLLERAARLAPQDLDTGRIVAEGLLQLRGYVFAEARKTGERERARELAQTVQELSRHALGHTQRMLELAPSFFDGQRLAIDAQRLLNPKQALEQLDALQREHPRDPRLFDLRHRCLKLLQRPAEALEAIEEAARLSPSYRKTAEVYRRWLEQQR